MTTATQVFKRTARMAAEGHLLIGGNTFENFDFVRVAADELERFIPTHLAFDELGVRPDRITHFELDLFKVARGEWLGDCEVIVKAVLDRRADS